MADPSEPLACPHCAARFTLNERFCNRCGMPLVYVGRSEQEPITEAHELARKIKPQYAQGELVRAATGRNLSEAELIQGILREEGIPSIQRRTGGFDVPDFLAAGPRDVLVPSSALEAAREQLEGTPAGSVGDPGGPESAGTEPGRLLFWFLVALAVATAITWLFYKAIG